LLQHIMVRQIGDRETDRQTDTSIIYLDKPRDLHSLLTPCKIPDVGLM